MDVPKGAVFLLFLPAACIAAGLFGALHDQLSYGVSREYFTVVKFPQFGLADPALPERLRAALVGFLASWWMGVPMGLLCGAAGFVQRSGEDMAKALGLTLALAVGLTLAVALCGLAYGWWLTVGGVPQGNLGWRVPAAVTQVRRFVCVAYMHLFAYAGGALSVPASWALNAAYRALAR